MGRGRILARRTVALGVLLAGLGALAWVAVAALGGDDPPPPPPPPPPPTAAAPARALRIVFPEGFNRKEMADRIQAVNQIARERRKVRPRLSPRQYLRSTARALLPRGFRSEGARKRLEGFLFPATYEFEARTTSKQLIEDQLEAFRRNWQKVDLRYARSRNLTPYDVLIIGSMIEEEVRAPEERRLVAAVIYNRLRNRMPLGIDATIRYALDVPPTESLLQSQLDHPTPYNTRLYRGLPPTPITNPGLAAMRAAARPANVNYLYFVRKPDKIHHFFTTSQREHDEYQRTHGS